MPKLIAIETTRYSEFFRRLLAEYSDGAAVEIDGTEIPAAEVLSRWCKNETICETRELVLKRHGIEICGFHDHPTETWLVESELSFAQRLASEHIVRFRILNCAR